MRSLDTAVGDLEARAEPAGQPTEEELSRLSLVQALRDFEVANGRVIDLTERLVVTAEELATTRQDADVIRSERDELRTRLDDLSARYEALLDTHRRTLERKSVKLGEAISAARRSIPSPRRDG